MRMKGSAQRFICIHGHFYQPPRENPWLESIEFQDSAAPYHDWNERINAECYAANGASRILDGREHILCITNNYARMSFNFGPTLLSWMEQKDPEAYQAILRADQESRQRFAGHGSAMAQIYNHIIMPLANLRDKYTQVRWGIRDFIYRFKRNPEGMWLAETAADMETLSILAEEGIKFTILSPYQARRIRPVGKTEWQDAGAGRIDPTRAYLQRLPAGRSIALFFYDGPISQAVAFEGILSRGELLVDRLVGAFSPPRDGPQLSHVATDGESYGHHHRFGDMALAYAFSLIESRSDVRLTNYGEFLELHPPTHEVEILKESSWSCSHGVERWRSDCGCRTANTPGWTQAWRGPLRNSLDWLRDALAPRFSRKGKQYFHNPWEARDAYISVILDRSAENTERFLTQHSLPGLALTDRVTALKLMELQRHSMYMFTSCGWFFDDLSGIEAMQVIRYAGRAVQLAEEVLECRVESRFLDKLAEAKSNIIEKGDGAAIYRREVDSSRIQLEDVTAHYAISSVFQDYPSKTEVHCYLVESLERRQYNLGKPKLVTGRLQVASTITGEEAQLAWGVLHFGDHNILCGVRRLTSKMEFEQMRQIWQAPADRADLTQIIKLLEKHFSGAVFSLRSLFRDERRRLINLILQTTIEETASIYKKIYQENAALMRLLSELAIPQPPGFRAAAEFALNVQLRENIESSDGDPNTVQNTLEEAVRSGVNLDYGTLIRDLEDKLGKLMFRLRHDSEDIEQIGTIHKWVEMARKLPIRVNPLRAQIICGGMLQTLWESYQKRGEAGESKAQNWLREFQKLAEKLDFSPTLFTKR